MSARQLTEAILDGGIRSIHFFNGRLLSGEDLSQEQDANQEERRRAGQAWGEGVAFGLEVAETTGISAKGAPVVTVEAGLAVNRGGQTLALAARTDVALTRPANSATEPGTFGGCDALPTDFVTPGAGVYLLVLAPACGAEGRAPVSGLGNGMAPCNARYA